MIGPVRRTGREAGAAAVEFVLMSVLLVLLLFGVLQVALYVYARNVVSSAVADAARYAATNDPAAGAERARDLIASGLNHRAAGALRCSGRADVDAASGLPTVTVQCRGRIGPAFLPFGLLPLQVDVSSSALREEQP